MFKKTYYMIPGIEYNTKDIIMKQIHYITEIYNTPIKITKSLSKYCAEVNTNIICVKRGTNNIVDLFSLTSQIITHISNIKTLNLTTTKNLIFVSNNDEYNYWISEMLTSETRTDKLIKFTTNNRQITNEFYKIIQNIELMRKSVEHVLYGNIKRAQISLQNGIITNIIIDDNYKAKIINKRGIMELYANETTNKIILKLFNNLETAKIKGNTKQTKEKIKVNIYRIDSI